MAWNVNDPSEGTPLGNAPGATSSAGNQSLHLKSWEARDLCAFLQHASHGRDLEGRLAC